MIARISMISLLLVGAAAAGTAQVPSKVKRIAPGQIVGKLADSLASSMAAGAIDSLLGETVRGLLSSGVSLCAVRDPSTRAIVGVVPGLPAGAGAAVVAAARAATGTKPGNPLGGTGAPALPALGGACPPGTQAMGLADIKALSSSGDAAALGILGGVRAGIPSGALGMPAGIGQGAAAPAGMPGLGAIAAVTPVGMAATAAPTAIKGMKKLFGGGAMSAEGMAKGLARGRLELKGVKFLPGSDEMQDGADPVFQQLAEVLGGFKAQFQLYIAPEAEKGVEPDVELAQRRVEKALAHIMTAGIPVGAIVAGGATPKDQLKDGKYPKLGDAKLELIKVQKTQ